MCFIKNSHIYVLAMVFTLSFMLCTCKTAQKVSPFDDSKTFTMRGIKYDVRNDDFEVDKTKLNSNKKYVGVWLDNTGCKVELICYEDSTFQLVDVNNCVGYWNIQEDEHIMELYPMGQYYKLASRLAFSMCPRIDIDEQKSPLQLEIISVDSLFFPILSTYLVRL